MKVIRHTDALYSQTQNKKDMSEELEKANNNFISFFKENITLILVALYSLSFINYYIYYKGFDISIFNYTGLNDLLFFSLEYIFNIILLIFICEVLLFMIFSIIYSLYEKFVIFIVKKKGKLYLLSHNRTKKRIENIFNNRFSNSLLNFRFTIILLSLFIIGFFPNKLIVIPTYFVYFVYYLEKIAKEKFLSSFTLIGACVIIIISTLISTLVNSYNKRFEKDDYIISFYEDSKFISTDTKVSCYNYLGETSSNIFLYDIETKESKIVYKENITDVKIKTKNNIDKYILKLKNTFMVKNFIEMINQK